MCITKQFLMFHCEIDAELDNYGQITHNLTEEVKVVVKTIEEQYASLQKNLANVIKTDY